MIIVSTREFREKQGSYLLMAKEGEDVILKSRENGSFKLVPITTDDALMDDKELRAKIDSGLKNIQEGKTTRYTMDELRKKWVYELLC